MYLHYHSRKSVEAASPLSVLPIHRKRSRKIKFALGIWAPKVGTYSYCFCIKRWYIQFPRGLPNIVCLHRTALSEGVKGNIFFEAARVASDHLALHLRICATHFVEASGDAEAAVREAINNFNSLRMYSKHIMGLMISSKHLIRMPWKS